MCAIVENFGMRNTQITLYWTYTFNFNIINLFVTLIYLLSANKNKLKNIFFKFLSKMCFYFNLKKKNFITTIKWKYSFKTDDFCSLCWFL